MIKIGIECESIEDQSWGVGRIINKLLEEISHRPELKSEFKFFLYFKSKVPDYSYLKNDIFVKKIVSVPWLPKSFSLYYYVFLPIKLWFEKLDVMFFPNYMLPIIFSGKSIVILTEDVYYEARGNLPFQYRLAYRIFPVWAAKHATRVMVISETSKKNVAELFKILESRIFVNQLAVDPVRTDGRGARPTSNGTSPPGDYILYVGQAFPRRHLHETILAFKKLVPKFPDLYLIAIGADKYNPPIIKELVGQINKQLGREAIVHKDYVHDEELYELYRNAKCLVYVSSREAFGLPPLEALAYGAIPVVAEDKLTREIFGDNAFFVEPHLATDGAGVKEFFSVDSIVSAINDCLTNENKRKSTLENAPAILSKYTWSAHTDRFLKLIREVTNE